MSGAKNPAAKEMLGAWKRARVEQTRKNLELASYASDEGGSEPDNHGSEDGIPP